MNALFAIDDTKDADTNQYHNQTTQASPKPTTTRRAKTIPAPTTQPTQPVDRFAAIKNAINSVPDTDALLELYLQHEQEVKANADILQLFTERKLQLKQAA